MINYRPKKRGRGLLNKAINKLPFELHIPGYQYCGPGTKLAKRLARGDSGINPLDAACKEHDIAYSENREDIEGRNAADRVLAERAWQRVRARDAGVGEKAAAWAVTNAMKLKSTFGMGLKRKKRKSAKKRSVRKRKVTKKVAKKVSETKIPKICRPRRKSAKKTVKKRKITRKKKTKLSKIIKAASESLKTERSAKKVITKAIKGAKEALKKAGGKKSVEIPKVLPVSPKIGGFLPAFLIPLFAGLSATGALAGGAAGVAKAINQAKAAQRQLEESHRHNKTTEAIASGKGLYLSPYRQGYGLYLRPYSGSGLKKKVGSNFT